MTFYFFNEVISETEITQNSPVSLISNLVKTPGPQMVPLWSLMVPKISLFKECLNILKVLPGGDS